eukprot:TRINITY_DN6165_c0_g1_i1.p1 TRINITY_DN6165_c0_g1~~TRINITY_DN6165_c0_g1_i1.p1  ORF type:complete len:351 (+),score=82.83 TRINITY_DN6165_c0_g1_i1:158-1210(+)
MYKLSHFRHACSDLRVSDPEEALPLVQIPPFLAAEFRGLQHVPLYYFDYAELVQAKGEPAEGAVAVTALQVVACDTKGSVRRCVDHDAVVGIWVDQSAARKETRVYIATDHGVNMSFVILRKAHVLLRAISSFCRRGVEVRKTASASEFNSTVQRPSLGPLKAPFELRTPKRNFLADPRLQEDARDLLSFESPAGTPRGSPAPPSPFAGFSTPPVSPRIAQLLGEPHSEPALLPKARSVFGDAAPHVDKASERATGEACSIQSPAASSVGPQVSPLPTRRRKLSAEPPQRKRHSAPLETQPSTSPLLATTSPRSPPLSAALPPRSLLAATATPPRSLLVPAKAVGMACEL